MTSTTTRPSTAVHVLLRTMQAQNSNTAALRRSADDLQAIFVSQSSGPVVSEKDDQGLLHDVALELAFLRVCACRRDARSLATRMQHAQDLLRSFVLELGDRYTERLMDTGAWAGALDGDACFDGDVSSALDAFRALGVSRG
jgi:hypothetical protein